MRLESGRNLLTRSIGTHLSEGQIHLDHIAGSFSASAADPVSLASLMAGGGIYKVARAGLLNWAPRLGIFASGTALALEVSGYRATHLAFEGKLSASGVFEARGWASDFAGFAGLKGAGSLSRGYNPVLAHFSQDLSMVASQHAASALTGSALPETGLVQQLLQAEAVNLQMSAGLELFHGLTGQALRIHETFLDTQAEALRRLSAERPGLSAWDLPAFIRLSENGGSEGGSLNPAVRKWIFVVNGSAGAFKSKSLAQEVRRLAEQRDPNLRILIYETHAESQTRIEEIARLIEAAQSTQADPLGLLAFGGDGTINNTLQGVMRFAAPKAVSLEESAARAAEVAFQSGLRVGTVALGSANDLALLYGAPGAKARDVMNYMDRAVLGGMNLGKATLDGGASHLFCHNACAGVTIAPSFRDTAHMRGRFSKFVRTLIVLRDTFLRHQLVDIRAEGGPSLRGREVFVNASLIANRMSASPAPQPGLGWSLLPDMNLRETLAFLKETVLLGFDIKRSRMERLLPGSSLSTLDPRLQGSHHVLESSSYRFFEGDRPIPVPVQANGDFVGTAQHFQVTALAAFPHFMEMPGSPMHRLQELMGRRRKQAASENTAAAAP